MQLYTNKLNEKFKEALTAVLPIVCIVLILSFTFAPMPVGTMLAFLLSSVLLVIGMMLFNNGAELAMELMGERIGAKLTKTKKLGLILALGFLLGLMVTLSEPDLTVLAEQVQSIPNLVLILAVAIGVGLFLVIALLRMLLGISLRWLLLGLYAATFILTIFAPEDFLAVAFDSGGVTTGPMTVPFIMAFGIGISYIRSDKHAADDSFGLIALCSVGPILAVLILAIIYHPEDVTYSEAFLVEPLFTTNLSENFLKILPTYIKEIAVSLLPIIVFFFIFQAVTLKLEKKTLRRIGIGLVYTYVGLVLFLSGVNFGFMPAGSYLGKVLASSGIPWIIIPLGMIIGYYIVKAEPAVYVLMRQVEELTDGAIPGELLQRCLSIGISVSVGLAMVRVVTGISIMWFLLPGYAIALTLSFFVPKMFTAVAFDSGGVASGPMTATFLLPFAVGACLALGGNVVTDAFGVVAMVAMTPLIAIQILGLVYRFKVKSERENMSSPSTPASEDLYAIIDL